MTNTIDEFFSPKGATADIVFVHGLGGDSLKTWTTVPNDEAPVERCWPKEFLKTACPTARILSFGYDSTFDHFFPLPSSRSTNQENIDHHSVALVYYLRVFREKTETPPERPIYFVAHSLGGHVVASALGMVRNDAGKEIEGCTRGAIFLGTPFEVSGGEAWELLAQKISELTGSAGNTANKLRERSRRLAVGNDRFHKLFEARDQARLPLKVACFFETWPTYVPRKNIGIIVSETMASLGPADAIPVSATHNGMCKFYSESVAGYKDVSGTLARGIKGDEPTSEPNTQHQGETIYHGEVNNSGIMTGNIMGQTPDAVKIIGTINYYGDEWKRHTQ